MFPADAAPGARRATGPVVRIPPNFFGIALGLSGLAELWLYASDAFGATAAIGDSLALIAAATWVVLTLAYLRQGPRQILADTRDAAVGPFLAGRVDGGAAQHGRVLSSPRSAHMTGRVVAGRQDPLDERRPSVDGQTSIA